MTLVLSTKALGTWHLADDGVLEAVAFKRGASLRKVIAGARGRFSTDVDFSVANLEDKPQQVLELVL